jgi:hypothetical protein
VADSGGVPQLCEEVVGVITAHQVVRQRNAHGRRRRYIGTRCQSLESFSDERKDLCRAPSTSAVAARDPLAARVVNGLHDYSLTNFRQSVTLNL